MLTFKKGLYSGEVTCEKNINGIIACVTDYHIYDYNSAMHCHENAHLSFMIQGGCVEKKRDAFDISPGSIQYYSSGEMHQVIKVAEPSRRVNLELEESFFAQFDLNDAQASVAISKNPEFKFLMIKIYKELLTYDSLSEISIQMLLFQLISQEQYHGQTNKLPLWISAVEEYLRDNPDEKVSLQELALITNMHPVTLSKNFPKYFHCTIGEYKRRIKIEKSLTLIKSSKLTLTDIALTCGFFDQNHFIRTFKHITGFLPMEYKRS
ncbi:AraC family transcriptional regulator [Mucilaginibacter conchicola]|uniref:AraC family transcriptional regulator n=1 Tax=Mucilaginibacter conchicola TaxID=2303333 RepID=A0A372NR74_9SPHI|nr:AraC family transcriptional regulator [Mucilaginibacter conchicola]RFZ91328.1 AraC family transcriptional regulator [Mucilaginibacter conchicola]